MRKGAWLLFAVSLFRMRRMTSPWSRRVLLDEFEDETSMYTKFLPSTRNPRQSFRFLALSLLFFLLVSAPVVSDAQECQDTPEGRICQVQQSIVAGVEVDLQTQKALGLVTVSAGCSGTLLNRFWVLTARHCVTTNGAIGGPLQPPAEVFVTAPWAPMGHVGRASRITDFAANAGAFVPGFDIVLVYLGAADLGAVNAQSIYATAIDQGGGSVVLSGRLRVTDTVTQYGRGFSTFATGTFGTATAVPSGGAGIYRSAQFTPSPITATGYTLAMNASSQVGQGGDSGGPTVVTVNGLGVGIAGVQSTCTPTGYITGTPVAQQVWAWATGISDCQYVATEPFLSEILAATNEAPPSCTARAAACGAIEASRLMILR